jgi:prepilin-type N-terminal cleavage/methylation domain-containing protein
MTSLTGNKTKGGFTFFEIMVTVTVLSIGIVMIYKALLLSLDYQNHLSFRLYALNLIDNQTAAINQQYNLSGEIPEDIDGQIYEVILNNRKVPFKLSVDYEELGKLEQIYTMSLSLEWPERDRVVMIEQMSFN